MGRFVIQGLPAGTVAVEYDDVFSAGLPQRSCQRRSEPWN